MGWIPFYIFLFWTCDLTRYYWNQYSYSMQIYYDKWQFMKYFLKDKVYKNRAFFRNDFGSLFQIWNRDEKNQRCEIQSSVTRSGNFFWQPKSRFRSAKKLLNFPLVLFWQLAHPWLIKRVSLMNKKWHLNHHSSFWMKL